MNDVTIHAIIDVPVIDPSSVLQHVNLHIDHHNNDYHQHVGAHLHDTSPLRLSNVPPPPPYPHELLSPSSSLIPFVPPPPPPPPPPLFTLSSFGNPSFVDVAPPPFSMALVMPHVVHDHEGVSLPFVLPRVHQQLPSISYITAPAVTVNAEDVHNDVDGDDHHLVDAVPPLPDADAVAASISSMSVAELKSSLPDVVERMNSHTVDADVHIHDDTHTHNVNDDNNHINVDITTDEDSSDSDSQKERKRRVKMIQRMEIVPNSNTGIVASPLSTSSPAAAPMINDGKQCNSLVDHDNKTIQHQHVDGVNTINYTSNGNGNGNGTVQSGDTISHDGTFVMTSLPDDTKCGGTAPAVDSNANDNDTRRWWCCWR